MRNLTSNEVSNVSGAASFTAFGSGGNWLQDMMSYIDGGGGRGGQLQDHRDAKMPKAVGPNLKDAISRDCKAHGYPGNLPVTKSSQTTANGALFGVGGTVGMTTTITMTCDDSHK